MFYGKKIKELEARVAELEVRTDILAEKVSQQSKEIDNLYALFVNQQPVAENPVVAPAPEKKPRRYRTRRKNGKENTATE